VLWGAAAVGLASVSCAPWQGVSIGDQSAGLNVRTRTVEGPPRQFLVVEIVREARPVESVPAVDVSACRWHVNQGGALYGDHWGWCEDFKILPRTSPGYLVTTTLFGGQMSGGYSHLTFMPALPADISAFGLSLRLIQEPARLVLEGNGARNELHQRAAVSLGTARAVVEPPTDTGHFEPGYETPVLADCTYSAVSYGLLDSRNIAGRAI
jgi:hypothetical protein